MRANVEVRLPARAVAAMMVPATIGRFRRCEVGAPRLAAPTDATAEARFLHRRRRGARGRTRCSDFGKTTQRSAGGCQVRASAGSRRSPPNDPLAVHERARWPSSAASPSPNARRSRRSGSRRVFVARRARARRCASADRAVHRARGAQREDRAPALVGAVRPDAGVPRSRTRRSRAKSRARAASASGSSCCPSSLCRQIVHLGLDAQGPAVSLRAVDSRQVGRAARAVLARVLAPDRAAAAAARARAAGRRRSSTST